MLCGTEEVSAILTELRITECEKFKMSVTNLNAILKSPENPSEDLIVSLFGTKMDFSLQTLDNGIYKLSKTTEQTNLKHLVSKLYAQEAAILIFFSITSQHPVSSFDSGRAEVDSAGGNRCLA